MASLSSTNFIVLSLTIILFFNNSQYSMAFTTEDYITGAMVLSSTKIIHKSAGDNNCMNELSNVYDKLEITLNCEKEKKYHEVSDLANEIQYILYADKNKKCEYEDLRNIMEAVKSYTMATLDMEG